MNTSKSIIREGVYFNREEYASFWLRLIVEVIDISVIMAISIASTVFITEYFSVSKQLINFIFLLWVGLWFVYFVLLKRSSFGTLGYKLCKIRVVNLYGEPPSILALTFRLMFAILGPLNMLFDLIWLSGDDNRQSLRDKFAKTYVVKRNAIAIGTGKLTYRDYYFLGYSLMFCEVKKADIPKKS
jgi:uncharacterized RDD family membrane protein YckC